MHKYNTTFLSFFLDAHV